MRISMSLQGNYDDIRRFIYQVESGTDFIVIDSVALRQGAEPGSPLDARPELVDLLPHEGQMEPKRRRELALASIAILVLGVAVWTMRPDGARRLPARLCHGARQRARGRSEANRSRR